jgi:hypothetical protein
LENACHYQDDVCLFFSFLTCNEDNAANGEEVARANQGPDDIVIYGNPLS